MYILKYIYTYVSICVCNVFVCVTVCLTTLVEGNPGGQGLCWTLFYGEPGLRGLSGNCPISCFNWWTTAACSNNNKPLATSQASEGLTYRLHSSMKQLGQHTERLCVMYYSIKDVNSILNIQYCADVRPCKEHYVYF